MPETRFRMLAIDLDGTLLSPRGVVTSRTQAAVRQAIDAGFIVCFATGRNWVESRAALEAVGYQGPAVFVGGAMVVDTRDGVTLQRTLMAADLARAVSAVIEEEGHAVLALQDSSVADADYVVSEAVPLDPATAYWMNVTSARVARVARLSEYGHEHTVRVGLAASRDESRRVRERLIAGFGDRIVCHALFAGALDIEVLEAFDLTVSKWQGLQHVAAMHAIRPEEIVAIGDDMNDVPMLEHAGLGVAMGNARPEAMAAADRVIGANADDGLAAFLEELVAQRLASR